MLFLFSVSHQYLRIPSTPVAVYTKFALVVHVTGNFFFCFALRSRHVFNVWHIQLTTVIEFYVPMHVMRQQEPPALAHKGHLVALWEFIGLTNNVLIRMGVGFMFSCSCFFVFALF